MSKVAEYLTAKVNVMLENGIIPWRKGWDCKRIHPMSITGHAYRGINRFLFSMLDYPVPVFITFNQIKKQGGKLKEGKEKAYHPCYFYSFLEKDDENGKTRSIPIFRYFNVWNIEDVEGIELPVKIQAMIDQTAAKVNDPIAEAEAIIAGYKTKPEIRHGGDRACYTPVIDIINMPEMGQFHDSAEYYATLFHEMGHSTGHASRLNRKELMELSADHAYNREELVAEMTSAILSMETGIAVDSMLENSAAYIAGWAKAIKAEANLLQIAASRAQKAADYIMGISYADKGEAA